jgi:uncharacterized protein YqjF (DUF2071 family)
MSNRKPFLTAEWRHLLMLNYVVEPTALEPLVPPGTILDTYQGKAYASLVAFLFLRTRLLGVPIPFHQDFEEVNLRFYVRRFAGGDWRRGVVFIQELVPKLAVALTARLVYNENYESLPMRHALETGPGQAPSSLRYEWEARGRWNGVRAKTAGEPHEPASGSLEEFITEHYWGYARQKDGSCVEYEVEHPRWRVWQASDAGLDCDAASVPGGEQFAPALSGPPASAFVADGSAVTVFQGNRV